MDSKSKKNAGKTTTKSGKLRDAEVIKKRLTLLFHPYNLLFF